MEKIKKMKPGRWIAYILAYAIALLWLFPVVWMIISSFKSYGTPVSILPELFKGEFTFDNYVTITEKEPVLRRIFNSFFVAMVVTVGTILITSLAAYAISKLRFLGKKYVFAIITAGMMVPMEAIIIPLYQNMAKLGLLNSYIGLMCPSLAAPIGVLIMKRFYDSIPQDLIEAGMLDGANDFQRWWKICVPISKSSMAAVGIFTFINSWNNFLRPFLSITL